MAASYIVEWVAVVDHPELRDPSLPAVPRNTRIRHHEKAAGKRAALARFAALQDGTHDRRDQYIGRVAVIRRERTGNTLHPFRNTIEHAAVRERVDGRIRYVSDRPAVHDSAHMVDMTKGEPNPDFLAALAGEAARERPPVVVVVSRPPARDEEAERNASWMRGAKVVPSEIVVRDGKTSYKPAKRKGDAEIDLVYARNTGKLLGSIDPTDNTAQRVRADGTLGSLSHFFASHDHAVRWIMGDPNTRPLVAAPGSSTAAAEPPVVVAAPPPGQLFAVEHEGFALTAPRGEFGGGSTRSQGTQQDLISRKVDTAKMGEIVERERLERIAARPADTSAPLLVVAEPEPQRPYWPRTNAPPTSAPASSLSDEAIADELARLESINANALTGEAEERHFNRTTELVDEALARRGMKERPTPPSDPEPGPRARLEFVDVATGEPRSPSAPGTATSGRIVAELEGVAVPIDSEDLIGRGQPEDPRARRYAYDEESPADYPAQARKIRAVKHRKPKPLRRPRAPGVQTTFRSPAAAAREFYDNNADFFDAVRDPIDGLRDWADGIDVRVSKRSSKRLSRTAAGAKIFAARQGQPQIEAALRWVFSQAKGRRWDAVPWQEIDRLEAALQPHREGGAPGIGWRPTVGPLDVATLDTMPPDVRQRVRDWESHVELKEALEQLRTTYRKTSACIPAELRRTALHRIKAWSSWERAPERIPAYACEPDEQSGGHLCNYPAVAGELRALRRACEEAYDPDWALPEARAGAPGFPDLSGGEPDIAPRPLPVLLRPEPIPVPPPIVVVVPPPAIAKAPKASPAQRAVGVLTGARAKRAEQSGYRFVKGKTAPQHRSEIAGLLGPNKLQQLDEAGIAVVPAKLTTRQSARLLGEMNKLRAQHTKIEALRRQIASTSAAMGDAKMPALRSMKRPLRKLEAQLDRMGDVEARYNTFDAPLPEDATSAVRMRHHHELRELVARNVESYRAARAALATVKADHASALARRTRAKAKPQRDERPTRPAPERMPEARPHTQPSTMPKTPHTAKAKKKPKASAKQTRTVKECASLLGKRGAAAKGRKRKERLDEAGRRRLLEDALRLATGR